MPVYWASGSTRAGGWRFPLALGLCSIILGLIFALLPGPTLQVLIYLFGALCLLIGLLLLVGAYYLSRVSSGLFFLPLIPGICAIILALVAFLNPGLVGSFLAVILAVVFILGGLALLFSSVMSRATLARMIPGVLAGGIFTVLGILILLYPEFSREAIIRLMGFFLVALGLIGIGWAVISRQREESGEVPFIDVEPIRKG